LTQATTPQYNRGELEEKMVDASRKSDSAQAAANQSDQVAATQQDTVKDSNQWHQSVLHCVLIMIILASVLWIGITQFARSDDIAIEVKTAPTDNELVSAMSKNLTEQLISDAIAYRNSDAQNREATRVTMNATAAKRRSYVETLMRDNPDEFLRIAISSDIKQELLQDVTGVESIVTLEGKLEINVFDREENNMLIALPRQLFIVSSSGATKGLYLPTPSISVDYGANDTVKVIGYELDDIVVPNTIADPNNFIVIDKAADPPTGTKRQVAVILVNLSDAGTPPAAFSVANALSTITSTDLWYREASFGTVYYSGKLDSTKSADVFGVYNIAANSSNCTSTYTTWRSQAQTAAAANGFTASGYQHIVTFINKSPSVGCGFSGVANWPGTQATVITATNVGTTIHEMGHNYGLDHSALNSGCRFNNEAVVFGGTCSQSEYGDMHDVMGTSSYRAHFNASHKAKLGWIPSSRVTTVTANGVYDLYPSDSPASGPQLIRIAMPYNIQLLSGDTSARAPYYYYLEHRVGTSSVYSANDYNGVFLRTGGTGSSNSYSPMSYLYRFGMTSGPSLPGASPCTGCLTGLRPGMVFKDPQNPNLSIKVLSWTATKATIEIIVDGGNIPPPPVCTRNAPTINVSPTSGMVDPGDSISYTVTITSNDSPSCTSINYTATPNSITSGFTFSPPSQSWSLAPDANNSHIFSITSPNSAADGIYTITFTASGAGNPTSSTQDVSFIVANTKAIPPTISISGLTENELIRSNFNTKVGVTATHSTGISKIEFYINGQLVAKCSNPKNSTCNIFIKGSNTATGTHTLKVIATAKDTEQTSATTNLTFRR